jgi:sodium-coupled neutral amino acid transporter 11
MVRFDNEAVDGGGRSNDSEEAVHLLSEDHSAAPSDPPTTNTNNGNDNNMVTRPSPTPLMGTRQSSLAQIREGPRTPNRVRFKEHDEDDTPPSSPQAPRAPNGLGWVDDEDYMRQGASDGDRMPLLTDIEAPSVTLASADDDEFNAEDLLETSRPKSGMRSAFMNMANSIMYVHCMLFLWHEVLGRCQLMMA